jgi:hypothetical protein
MVTDQDIAFLVHDLCRATVRNYNGISAYMVEDTIENDSRLGHFDITMW